MKTKELLPIFEKAVEYWSKPYDCSDHATICGLCLYFSIKHPKINYKRVFMPYWIKYRTTSIVCIYHFYGTGADPLGRNERIEALKKVVEDIKLLIQLEKKPFYIKWWANIKKTINKLCQIFGNVMVKDVR